MAVPAVTDTNGAGGRLRKRRRSVLFDVMVAVVIALMSVLFGTPSFGPAPAIGVAMAVALLVRRRHSLAVMAAVSMLALLQLYFSDHNDPRPFDIAVLIAMYSVVKYSSRLWHGLAAAVPVAAGIVIEIARHLQRAGPTARANAAWVWTEALIFLVAVCVAVWLTAYTVRTRRLYVLGLEERAATAERERDHLATIAVAQERAVIARELHDIVAHSMAVMIVQADGASYVVDRAPEQARKAIRQVSDTGREALQDMRRLVGVLRGAAHEPQDEQDRRRVSLDQLDALVDRARSAGLVITLDEDGQRAGLPAAVELTVFRLVQEALTNVLRHAGTGAQVALRLRYQPGMVHVEVSDNGGRRLVPTPRPAGGGHGLVGMRERVTIHGGEFSAGPRLGGGWQLSAEIPWT
jgi:signal transduction histidine kinase